MCGECTAVQPRKPRSRANTIACARVHTPRQPLADLGVGQPLTHEREHFPLASREGSNGVVFAMRSETDEIENGSSERRVRTGSCGILSMSAGSSRSG